MQLRYEAGEAMQMVSQCARIAGCYIVFRIHSLQQTLAVVLHLFSDSFELADSFRIGRNDVAKVMLVFTYFEPSQNIRENEREREGGHRSTKVGDYSLFCMR